MDLAASKRLAENCLLTIQQNGWPLEKYVKEFLGYYHQVCWSKRTLKACFWEGLDDDWFDWYASIAW